MLVSSSFFHSESTLLLASFTWKHKTQGTFHAPKARASLLLRGITRKSLKRCHWLPAGASASQCATAADIMCQCRAKQSNRALLTIRQSDQVWSVRVSIGNVGS